MLRLLAFALIATLLGACEQGSQKPKQKTTVTLLPDTPPPPPPPPPKGVPPPPKDAPKEVKMEQPKQEAPPQQAEQLKMDGPAGDAPSNFAAGDVKGEYTGQVLGDKPGGLPGGVDRAVFETYKTRLQRLLQEELVKMKELKGADYRIPARIRRNGAQWSVTLPDSTGDARIDELLREAVARAIEREMPPASAPRDGFNVRVSNKLLN